jgi:integrase
LNEMFGTVPVRQFGPKSLRALQDRLIRDGLARGTINSRIGRIKRMFKWATADELIGPEIPSALATVPGLRRGYSGAKETEPVGPVPDEHVDAVRPHVSKQVWAMIELQRWTGARPGEIVAMRTRDLEMTGPVWTYRPERHKTWARGKSRVIYLGPRAQEIVKPWLRARRDEPLFQPREVDADRKAEMRQARRSRVQPSQADRSRPDAVHKPGEFYTVASYGKAVRRACEAAGVPVWSPNRLRHATGTRVRKLFGVEGAQVILGHARADVTQVYAERNETLAMEIAQRVG